MARLRIIAGKYGGRFINADVARVTHPMGDRVRSAMFSMLESRGVLKDAKVLDAFAGTGAVGLEALSRGARFATFLEKDKTASKIIDVNITTLNASGQAKNIHTGVSSWTETTVDDEYDIIFVDPPYHKTQFSTVQKLVGYLRKNGLMILSYPERGTLPDLNGVVVVDNRIYGEAALALFRLVSDDD